MKLVLKEFGKPESLISFVKDRPGHDRRYAINASKIHQELGWKPIVPFSEGIAKTLDWYRAHESWWRRIISGEYQQYFRKMYEER